MKEINVDKKNEYEGKRSEEKCGWREERNNKDEGDNEKM